MFSTMTRLLDILGAYLDWRGISYLRLDGGTPSDERGELVRSCPIPRHAEAVLKQLDSRFCMQH